MVRSSSARCAGAACVGLKGRSASQSRALRHRRGAMGAASFVRGGAKLYRRAQQFGRPLPANNRPVELAICSPKSRGLPAALRVGRLIEEGRVIPVQSAGSSANNAQGARYRPRRERHSWRTNSADYHVQPCGETANLNTMNGPQRPHALILAAGSPDFGFGGNIAKPLEASASSNWRGCRGPWCGNCSPMGPSGQGRRPESGRYAQWDRPSAWAKAAKSPGRLVSQHHRGKSGVAIDIATNEGQAVVRD